MSDNSDGSKSSASTLIACILAFGFGYAILRYHIAGPIPWIDLSFFTLNKGMSLSAFTLLILNFSLGPAKNLGLPIPDAWLNARMALGITGFLLVLIHVLMSMMLFSPAVYASFFEADGSVSLKGGLSMFAGIIAFVILWGYNLSFKTTLREDQAFMAVLTSRKFLLWSMLFIGAHLCVMGYAGWLNPGGWHGGLPPISLVSFVFFALGYVINLFGRE